MRGQRYVDTVLLTASTEALAYLVVVGIGSRLATEWLDGSGIEVDNGVICDEDGRTGASNVRVLGDVAFWRGSDGTLSSGRTLEQLRCSGLGCCACAAGSRRIFDRGCSIFLERPI
ncbi:hypothetical protein A8144_09750 [Mycobacterium leprae 3125609]|nr:hypothetical protein A8144_09750 [Mycobacterium leprae 3125609]OAX70832.1 hypothetical protein A3216_09535 [Mycobacterium leprae 7935681]